MLRNRRDKKPESFILQVKGRRKERTLPLNVSLKSERYKKNESRLGLRVDKYDSDSTSNRQKPQYTILPEWKQEMLQSLRKHNPDAKVVYLLPNKTGTMTVCDLLHKYKSSPLLGEHSHTHARRARRGCINIMTIRDPVHRIKSYIDYIASRWDDPEWAKWRKCHKDRFKELKACRFDDINTVPQKIYRKQFITNTSIQKTQTSYASPEVICLTLKEIPEAIQILLKLDHVPELPHVNKSGVRRPPFNEKTISWLNNQKHIQEDTRLWNEWTRLT